MNTAKELAQELLGDIHYNDSRDNPEWKKEIVRIAANLIQNYGDERIKEYKKELRRKKRKI